MFTYESSKYSSSTFTYVSVFSFFQYWLSDLIWLWGPFLAFLLIKVNEFTGGSKLFFKYIPTAVFQQHSNPISVSLFLYYTFDKITTWSPVSLPWAGLKYVIGVHRAPCYPFHSGGPCWHVTVDGSLCIIFNVSHFTVISRWVLAWWFMVNNACQPMAHLWCVCQTGIPAVVEKHCWCFHSYV